MEFFDLEYDFSDELAKKVKSPNGGIYYCKKIKIVNNGCKPPKANELGDLK